MHPSAMSVHVVLTGYIRKPMSNIHSTKKMVRLMNE